MSALRTAFCGLHGETQNVQALFQMQKKAGAGGNAVPLLPTLVQLPGVRTPHHHNQRVQLSPLRKQSFQVTSFRPEKISWICHRSTTLEKRRRSGKNNNGRVAQWQSELFKNGSCSVNPAAILITTWSPVRIRPLPSILNSTPHSNFWSISMLAMDEAVQPRNGS